MSFFNDTFTDTPGTAASSHTTDSGGSWGNQASGVIITASGRLRIGNSTGTYYATASVQALGSTYTIDADVIPMSFGSGDLGGGIFTNANSTCGRKVDLQFAGTGTDYGIKLRYYWEGTLISIATIANCGMSAGATYHLKFTTAHGSATGKYNYTGTLTRASDGYYLTSAGAWQASPANCIAVTDWNDPAYPGYPAYPYQDPGYHGVHWFDVSGSDSTGLQIDNYAASTPVTATLAISPTSVNTGSTTNIALTGTGTSWTSGTPGSPTFTVSGGTINSQTVTSGTTAAINYTAPGTAGSVTIGDPTGGTATLTVAAGLSAGVLSTTPNDGTSITLSSTGPSAGTAPYTRQLYRSSTAGFVPPGAGTLVATQTGAGTLTWTDTGATTGTVYYYKEVVTDSAGSPATSVGNEAPASLWQTPITLGLIGDSITAGAMWVPRLEDLLKSARGPRKLGTTVNAGASSSTSTSWRSGSANMNAALSAFSTGNVTHVLVMLGTNGSADMPTYLSDMTNITSTLVATGVKVFLLGPPYSTVDSIAAMVTLQRAELAKLHNGTTIFWLDDRQFELAASSYASGQTAFLSDGVHYNSTGGPLAGDAIYRALDAVLYPVSAGVTMPIVIGG